MQVAVWHKYIQSEMNLGDQAMVKQAFSRCLLSCPSIDLWTLYLTFVKKSNDSRGVEGLAEVRSAYEFTLDGEKKRKHLSLSLSLSLSLPYHITSQPRSSK
jgi:hypothetical protein